jgi:hypothetical protein
MRAALAQAYRLFREWRARAFDTRPFVTVRKEYLR